MSDPSEVAVARFGQGFNCAQSVLAAFAARAGLDESQALRMASPFGAGISRRGEVCGAVTGALMVIGLLQGSDTPAGRDNTYRQGQEFLHRFGSEHGTILCRELLDYDVSTPEGLQQARDSGVFTQLCPLFVRTAATIVQSMLAEGPG